MHINRGREPKRAVCYRMLILTVAVTCFATACGCWQLFRAYPSGPDYRVCAKLEKHSLRPGDTLVIHTFLCMMEKEACTPLISADVQIERPDGSTVRFGFDGKIIAPEGPPSRYGESQPIRIAVSAFYTRPGTYRATIRASLHRAGLVSIVRDSKPLAFTVEAQ